MRNIRTLQSKTNAILQKLKPKKKDWILLVEGKSDKIFYSKFLIEDNNVLLNTCDGHSNLLEIVKILRSRNHDQFLGIIDSDFRRLDEDLVNDSQVFQTDFHDIELSIIESRALSDVLVKYKVDGRFEKFESDMSSSFKDCLYKLAENLGYLKWANKKDDLGLVFKPNKPEGNKIKFEKFINRRTLKFISHEALIDYIMQYSKNRETTTKPKDLIKVSYDKIMSDNGSVDRKQLCNGHDLCQIISLGLKQVIGSTNVSGEAIEENLIFAYDTSAFKNTILYSEIKTWERSNIQVFI